MANMPSTSVNPIFIKQSSPWGMILRCTGGLVSITGARCDIRYGTLKTSPLAASFRSDGSGIGTCTIDGLDVTFGLTADQTESLSPGLISYDVFMDTDIGDDTFIIEDVGQVSPSVTVKP